MLDRRSLSILSGWIRWRRLLPLHLCSRCSRVSCRFGIRLAGVFLWAIADLSPISPIRAQPIAAIAADLETIRERGELIVGVKDALRPLGFRDRDGQLQGFEIDLARQLAADLLGDPEAISFVVLSNTERLQAVYDRVDVTIAQVSINASRQRLVRFSSPYWIDGTTLLVRDDRPFENVGFENFERGAATIAVLQGSDAIAALRWQYPEATLVGVESYREALEQFEAGEIDAFAGDRSVAIGWTQIHPGYRILPDYITSRSLAIVLPRGLQYATLRDAVNASLEAWLDSGGLEARLEAWGLLEAIGKMSEDNNRERAE